MTKQASVEKPGFRWLFVSDVDDTLLGDDKALRVLNKALKPARASQSVKVVYNSSRPCASLRRSMEENSSLLAPDYLIGALGTEIQVGSTGQLVEEYAGYLDNQWDRQKAVKLALELGFTPHAAEFQTPFKASFDVKGIDDYRRMVDRMEAEALEAKVIFSGSKNLDLIPTRAGKGRAIQYLRRLSKIGENSVIVAGDSGNDIEMFAAPNKGIVVANADNDLKRIRSNLVYHASAGYAAGVLEGLRYWGVLV